MKTKTSKFWLFFAFLMLPVASQAATFSYSPLEKIPGSDTVVITDFYTYVQAIYKFGIWAVGIAALLMITIGAYMYITSAGNNTSMEKAKSVISDAIIGLILALLAYLLLYVINPDLLTVQRLPNVATGGPAAIPPTGPATPGGGCSKIVSAAQNMMNAGCIYDQSRRNGCTGSPGYTDCSNLVDTTYKQSGCTSPGNLSSTIAGKAEAIGDSSTLKPGDVLSVPGHVVICANDGCTQVIGAAGVGKNIKYSNGSYYINQGATVVRASKLCSAC